MEIHCHALWEFDKKKCLCVGFGWGSACLGKGSFAIYSPTLKLLYVSDIIKMRILIMIHHCLE